MRFEFIKTLEKFFIAGIILALSYISYSWYQDNQFKSNPLSAEIQKRVRDRQSHVRALIQNKYNIQPKIPIVISDEFHSNLYGLTGYKEGKIKILLNKKRFKESEDYMIDEVIPHEYAHAMVFILGKKTSEDGHTKSWQKICFELDGKQCERYVDNEEIIRQKMGLRK